MDLQTDISIMEIKEKLKDRLKLEEGVKYTVYFDSVGVPTIGVGHNLHVPVSDKVVDLILEEDLDKHLNDLYTTLPWVINLSENRQLVLGDMCFNLGITGLLTFRNTLKAFEEGRWEDAANGLQQSLWAHQVGSRAVKLIKMVREG